jgi:hypothetical protein
MPVGGIHNGINVFGGYVAKDRLDPRRARRSVSSVGVFDWHGFSLLAQLSLPSSSHLVGR